MHLIDKIKAKAQSNLQTVVLPESYDERMFFAAERATKEGLAKIVLLGNLDKVKETAAAKGVDLTGVEILDPATSPKLDAYVDQLVEIRKSKGLTPEDARKLLTGQDNLYYAGMMVRMGDAGGCVAGATSTTGNVIRSAIQTIGTAPGIKTVSSFFIMVTKDAKFGENGIVFFADCAVNPNPDSQALAEIAVATAANCKAFLDVDARVAMLSFSTKGSAAHPDVDKVTKARDIAKQINPDLQIDGELQADAALIPSIGEKKAPAVALPAKRMSLFPRPGSISSEQNPFGKGIPEVHMVGVGSFEDGGDILGEDQFLVGGDDEDLDRRVGGSDDALTLAGHGIAVLLPVELDAHMLETVESPLADLPAHLADAGGEDHGVESADRRAVGADVFLQAVGLDVQGQGAFLAAVFRPFDDIPTVGELTGNAQNSRFLVEDRVDFLGREAFLLLDEHRNGRVDVAAAGSHDRPFEGGEAHAEVSTETPPLMAVWETPLPICMVMMLQSFGSLSSSTAALFDT
jgi:phosphate acetyltransferase